MADCLFCDIVDQKKPAKVVMEDDHVVAFEDINPQAPVHILIVPRRHIATVNDLAAEDAAVVGQLFLAAQRLAAEQGIHERGYRLVMNCNQEAGQSVYHIHLHLLGGRWLRWPPG